MRLRCGVGMLAVTFGCSEAPPLIRPTDTDAGPVRPWDIAMTSAPAQPPLAGGTLLVTPDGASAVVADPDHARLVVVDLVKRSVRGEIPLGAEDEPGRAAADGAGRVFVALRRGGALLTIDSLTARVVERRAVCAQPRGVAYDADRDRVLVACAEGVLVALPAAGGEATSRVALDDDLRDVMVHGDRLYVSRFRSADVLVLDLEGAVLQRLPGGADREVAWRTVVTPAGDIVTLHQRATSGRVSTGDHGYAGGGDGDAGVPCNGGIVRPMLSVLRVEGAVSRSLSLAPNSLSIDLAVLPSGMAVIAMPGNWGRAGTSGWLEFPTGLIEGDRCVQRTPPSAGMSMLGQVVAAAALPGGGALVQTRAPAALVFTSDLASIPLGGSAEADTGHRMFHTNPEGAMTCASCHPEGNDDGHTWNFSDVGARRTPMLRGGLLGTEPFHWSGDLRDFGHLVDEVLTRRMGAPRPSPAQSERLARWVDALPALRAPAAAMSSPAAARGRELFARADVGCATCHGGERFTNNQTVDVGTRGAFQVPSLLGLRWRAPYLHDGCAPTLRDRFGDCGGGDQHGRTSQLAPAQIDDLVAYLETL
jgi:mono/diheme cytochrome c family protein